MKWKSHLRIAKLAGEKLGVEHQDLVQLSKGVIAPDSWRDHSLHHNSEYLDKRIKETIIRARKYFLHRKKKCYYILGVALHYIMDRLIQTDSYAIHLSIEEELAKLSEESKSSKHFSSQTENIREAINSLDIEECAKNLLLTSDIVKGKAEVMKLAMLELPKMPTKLLFNIARRIALGVAQGVLSDNSPPELLQEKVQYFIKQLNVRRLKFKLYCIMLSCLPLMFLYYSIYGYMANMVINLPLIFTIQAMFKNPEIPLKEYIRIHEISRTLWALFIILGILFLFTPYKYPATIFFLSIAFSYLCYPRIPVDRELKAEYDWYRIRI